jgi:hypothetical protein
MIEPGALDPLTNELIYIAVSATNDAVTVCIAIQPQHVPSMA